MEKKNFFFAFSSMVVLLKDRQCQVPSQRASEWKIFFLFAFASMMVLLEDRKCQVPSLRASKWKKTFFSILEYDFGIRFWNTILEIRFWKYDFGNTILEIRLW